MFPSEDRERNKFILNNEPADIYNTKDLISL